MANFQKKSGKTWKSKIIMCSICVKEKPGRFFESLVANLICASLVVVYFLNSFSVPVCLFFVLIYSCSNV